VGKPATRRREAGKSHLKRLGESGRLVDLKTLEIVRKWGKDIEKPLWFVETATMLFTQELMMDRN